VEKSLEKGLQDNMEWLQLQGKVAKDLQKHNSEDPCENLWIFVDFFQCLFLVELINRDPMKLLLEL
jgi:hypothetical protein